MSIPAIPAPLLVACIRAIEEEFARSRESVPLHDIMALAVCRVVPSHEVAHSALCRLSALVRIIAADPALMGYYGGSDGVIPGEFASVAASLPLYGGDFCPSAFRAAVLDIAEIRGRA